MEDIPSSHVLQAAAVLTAAGWLPPSTLTAIASGELAGHKRASLAADVAGTLRHAAAAVVCR